MDAAPAAVQPGLWPAKATYRPLCESLNQFAGVADVLILPITFEPFDRPRRQIVGSHSPWRLSRKWDGRSGRLAQTQRNRGVTRSARPGAQHKGISIMKIVTIVTAGLVAMLSVAAAATPAAAHPYDQYIRGRSFFGALFGPSIARGVVSYPTNQKPGTIVVSTAQRRLYLVLGNGQALSYAIAVGAAGYAWSGASQITDKREWPDWTPPEEMLQRRHDLPRHMAGGPDNPMGARAIS